MKYYLPRSEVVKSQFMKEKWKKTKEAGFTNLAQAKNIGKPMQKTANLGKPMTTEEIIKEFREKFVKVDGLNVGGKKWDTLKTTNPKDIEAFLLNALSLSKQETLKEVERMKRYKYGKPTKPQEYTDCTCGYGYDDCECDYNQALDDVATLLTGGKV